MIRGQSHSIRDIMLADFEGWAIPQPRGLWSHIRRRLSSGTEARIAGAAHEKPGAGEAIRRGEIVSVEPTREAPMQAIIMKIEQPAITWVMRARSNSLA
jgi:hypothetical protein